MCSVKGSVRERKKRERKIHRKLEKCNKIRKRKRIRERERERECVGER